MHNACGSTKIRLSNPVWNICIMQTDSSLGEVIISALFHLQKYVFPSLTKF